MKPSAVVVYDLSGKSGYAVYEPGLADPVFGVVNMPPSTTGGSVGPAGQLLFEHITWVNRRWPLAAIGFEAFIPPPTGGKKDKEETFVTSPAAVKKLIGLIVVLETCAAMLGLEPHSLHNASWRRYWLGPQKRGTTRQAWKEMSKEKALALGWQIRGDDDADAIGQLHFLLAKLEIKPDWNRRPPSRALVDLGIKRGIPVHV